MEIPFHPLANLFPLMEGAEFDALVADISEHGLREPVVLHEGQILDGRNRYRACEEAGLAPSFEDWNGKGEIQAYVISKNLHRRHLNESQRAMVAAKLATRKREDTLIPGGPNALSLEGQIPSSSGMSGEEAATLLNVSRSTVVAAKKVQREGTPEEIEAVERGETSVSTVARQISAKVPPEKRAKKRAEPMAQAGKNPERIQKQQLNAELWARLRDALSNLSSLPLAADTAAIVRGNHNSAAYVDARLAKSLQWITEFSDAWNAHE